MLRYPVTNQFSHWLKDYTPYPLEVEEGMDWLSGWSTTWARQNAVEVAVEFDRQNGARAVAYLREAMKAEGLDGKQMRRRNQSREKNHARPTAKSE